jgi:ABC-type Na+ efflux pump permease subunit
LLWKEVYHCAGKLTGYTFWQIYLPTSAILALVAFLIISLAALGEWMYSTDCSFSELVWLADTRIVNPIMRTLIIGLSFAWCVAVAWRTASSITSERENRTLGALLTLPSERAAVLRAKWWGGILRWRWLGILLLAVSTVAILSGAFHPLAVLLYATAIAAHIAFLASAGITLSLLSRTSMWANFNASLLLLLIFAGSWVAGIYYEVLFGGLATSNPDWWDDFSEIGMNPLGTWWYLGLTWEEFRAAFSDEEGGLRRTLGATLAGIGVYATLAELLWLFARLVFSREDAV